VACSGATPSVTEASRYLAGDEFDLFETPIATIDALHSAGRIVVCYISAGSHENTAEASRLA
jgi:hypothetical protein